MPDTAFGARDIALNPMGTMPPSPLQGAADRMYCRGKKVIFFLA